MPSGFRYVYGQRMHQSALCLFYSRRLPQSTTTVASPAGRYTSTYMTDPGKSMQQEKDRDHIRGTIYLSRHLEQDEEFHLSELLGMYPNLKFGYPDATVASGVISIGGIEAIIDHDRGRVDNISLGIQFVPKGTGDAIVKELQRMVMAALDEIGFPREEVTGKFVST